MIMAAVLTAVDRLFPARREEAERSFSPFGAKRDQVIALLQDRDLPDEEVRGRLALVLAGHALIMDLTLNENGPDRNLLPEIARQFSSEIEYSDENPERLIGMLMA